MERLLEAVRKAALPGIWSQGVKMAREGAVVAEGPAVFRVKAPTRVAPTVTLYPDDGEWTCDCESKVDPCAHVAAAAIAAAQGTAVAPPGASAAEAEATRDAGTAVPVAAAKLRYHLARKQGALTLERLVVSPSGAVEPLTGSLASALARGGRGLAVVPTHDDLVIDRLVAGRRPGWFPSEHLAEVVAALASADVAFEGRPVAVSAERIGPRAAVDDDGDGVVLVVDRDPRVTEVVAPGLGLCEGTLRPLADTDLTGARLEKLPLVRRVPAAQLGTLVADVLPELERRMAVAIRTKRLPRMGARSRPRVAFDLAQEDHSLWVLPTLVYGDPPTARIDEGRLVQLGALVPVRDEGAERDLVTRLRDELHLVPGRRTRLDGADAARFAARLLAWTDGGTPVMATAGTLVPRVDIGDASFDLRFELETDGDAAARSGKATGSTQSLAGAAVVEAWRQGLPFVPLPGGGFAKLPTGWLEQHGALVTDLLDARREDGRVEPAARPALGELCDALEQPRPPGLARLLPLFEGFDALPQAPLPPDLTATLRSYQRHGIDWLCFLRDAGLGAVLADDMGLGKTLQTLCALRGRCLVVCPRSVVHNWAAELQRFRPGLTHALYHGPRRALDPNADVTLTTYAVLRLDAEQLAAVHWDVVVLDESQAIKNPDSQVARAAYGLDAAFRVALSGTPVENRLAELWSQLHFTNRGLLGGRSSFGDRFEGPIAAGDRGAAQRLRARIKPFVLRRLKRDVAPELPPRTDAVLYVELDETERAVYDAVRAATQKEIVARLAEGGNVLAALEALLRLRQAACHTALVPGQHADSSSKVVRLVESLEDVVADGHRALVFSQWTSLLDLVEPHLTEAGIAFDRLDGTTRDRAGVVGRFQSEAGAPVLLVSLKAGGSGLNLTAADHVFLLDPWWNPAVEDQAKDRAHRIGQDKPVLVYRLVAKDTVEEGILSLQERKRGLADTALGEAEQAAALTRDDLLALLR